jgi:hypothetical protein
MTRVAASFAVIATLFLSASCTKGDGAADTATANDATGERLGCDHDLSSTALAKHSWPYPADYRHLRKKGGYQKFKLKLKPNHAAFVTATVTWKEGDLIEVLDSEVRITKPRRLVAKRDLFVRRKVWDQGIEVERTYLAAAAGELGSFLFYNSRGACMVDTPDGPGWTPCTLDDAFEGLSAEDPHPCEQVWWVRVQRRKVDKGWMIVNPAFLERVAPQDGATK